MMLDLVEGRKVFADYLQSNFHKSKSLDAALMAAMEWAYRRGLDDCAEVDTYKDANQLVLPGL